MKNQSISTRRGKGKNNHSSTAELFRLYSNATSDVTSGAKHKQTFFWSKTTNVHRMHWMIGFFFKLCLLVVCFTYHWYDCITQFIYGGYLWPSNSCHVDVIGNVESSRLKSVIGVCDISVVLSVWYMCDKYCGSYIRELVSKCMLKNEYPGLEIHTHTQCTPSQERNTLFSVGARSSVILFNTGEIYTWLFSLIFYSFFYVVLNTILSM